MNEVALKAEEIFNGNHAMTLASTGGEYSPWVLGVYFASERLDLYFFLETSGKTYANVLKNPRVAFVVSKNDAQQDFLQGTGKVTILAEEASAMVRARLEQKMPWYKTYTPVAPVRIDVDELFVSSLQNGWFPAKRLQLGASND